MENIMKVVRERNIAVDMVERGETDEVTPRKYARNVFGLPINTPVLEHHKPKHESARSQKMFMQYRPWMDKYSALYEEKLRLQRNREFKQHQRYQKKVMNEFDVKTEDLPAFKRGKASGKLERYVKSLTQLNDHGQRK